MNTQKQQQNAIHQLHDVLSLLDIIADGQSDKIGPAYLLASVQQKIQNVLAHLREGSIQHACDDQRLSFSITHSELKHLKSALDTLILARENEIKLSGVNRATKNLSYLIHAIANVMTSCEDAHGQTVDRLEA